MEKWIYLNNEKSKYKISSDGYVISTAYKGKEGVVHALKHNHDADGYCIITLNHRGKKYTRKIHRLVAEAFIPNPDNLPEVNHKNGDKDKNDISNLEWVSTIDNIYHALATNLRYNANTEEQVHRVCQLLEKGIFSIREISELTDVSMPNVIKIKNGVRWKQISSQYNFPEYTPHYAKGSENKASSITELEAKRICECLEKGFRPMELSKMLDISLRTISSIFNRETWKHVSYEYNF